VLNLKKKKKKKKTSSAVTFSNVKKKAKKDQPLNTKTISKKKASVMTWMLVVIIPLLVLVGTIRMFGVLGQVEQMQEEITIIRSQERSSSAGGEALDITLITHTMNEFVPLFMNVNLTNQDVINNRIDELSQFVNFDISQINHGIDHHLSRMLTHYDMLSVRHYNTHLLASYRVSYQIDYGDVTNERLGYVSNMIDDQSDLDEEMELEDEVLELTEYNERQLILNIPFVMVDGLITVVSMPYFTDEQPALNNEVSFDLSIENDPREELRASRESISLFLPTFFEMYARSDSSELALFMAHPVLMGGNFNVYSVDITNARFMQIGQNMMVQVFVTFQDQDVDFFHTIPFTLVLEEQANSWFVLELYHLFVNE